MDTLLSDEKIKELREDAFSLSDKIKGISNDSKKADWDSYKAFMHPSMLKPNASQPVLAENKKNESFSPKKKKISGKQENSYYDQNFVKEINDNLGEDFDKNQQDFEPHHSRQKSSPLISSEILGNHQFNNKEFIKEEQNMRKTMHAKDNKNLENNALDKNDNLSFFEKQKKLKESIKLKTQESRLYISQKSKGNSPKNQNLEIKFAVSEHNYQFSNTINNQPCVISPINNRAQLKNGSEKECAEAMKKYENINLLDSTKGGFNNFQNEKNKNEVPKKKTEELNIFDSSTYAQRKITQEASNNKNFGGLPNLFEIDFNHTVSKNEEAKTHENSIKKPTIETIFEDEKENLESQVNEKQVLILMNV